MDSPKLIVVGGPNGAGKSTFAIDYAVALGIAYFGADAIAAELAPHDPYSMRIRASKLFLERIRESVEQRKSLVLESTLAGKSLRRFIESAKQVGYQTTVLFTFLDSADTCVDRVLQRTRNGGHHVPEADVRRRFVRSINNFWHIYRLLADTWMLVYNGGESPEHVALGYGDRQIVRINELFNLFHSNVVDQ